MKRSSIVLLVIVFSQFFCTSLWFAGNGVMNDLVQSFGLNDNAVGNLTSAVQLGFIIGTLSFAVLTIADRFSPSKVFLISAILGSTFNLGIIWDGNSLESILVFRFLTGFFLAGIYPVGMKIAADHFDKGLGKSLGYLVGALVLGTSLPHLLKDLTGYISWQNVIIGISALATLGGSLMVLLVPDGPFRKAGAGFDTTVFLKVFKNRDFRSSAFGYFGHMWELYAFWAFVPVMIRSFNSISEADLNIPFFSFLIIGSGGLACVAGAYLAQRLGEKRIASLALFLSGLCCLISPFSFSTLNEVLFISFLIFWGLVVIADSPLFSTLVAKNAPSESKGTALTIVNCIGFAITIVSIQLISLLQGKGIETQAYIFLAIGPILGLVGLYQKGQMEGRRPKFEPNSQINGPKEKTNSLG